MASRLKKGLTVLAKERPTYEHFRHLFTAGRIESWSILDRDEWCVVVDGATETFDLAGARSWLVDFDPAYCEPAKTTEVPTFDPACSLCRTLPLIGNMGQHRLHAVSSVSTPPVKAAPKSYDPSCVKCRYSKPGDPGSHADHVSPEPVKAPKRSRKLASVPTGPVVTTGLPEAVTAYLDRLVYAAKRDYAEALAVALLTGGDEPAHPGREWADKVRARLDKLLPARSAAA